MKELFKLLGMENVRLADPLWLWALLLIPLLAVLRSAAGRKVAVQFGSLGLLAGLGKSSRSAMGAVWMTLLAFTVAGAAVALARPQRITVEEHTDETGVEIFFALDLSLSMSIRDMYYDLPGGGRQTVNRLTVLKNVVRNFIRGRQADRIGFVVFSGRPYLASPLTLDKDWLESKLKDIDFNQTTEMGTAIGSSIATAATRLNGRKVKSRIIILVTDGANNSGKLTPIEAAKDAAKLGVRIYAVAIGTEGYHEVPELLKMNNGYGTANTVRQEYDEGTLKEVANLTNGRFYQARDTRSMEKIFAEIDRLEKTKLEVHRTTHTEELFSRPLWFAVISAAIVFLLHQTLLRRYP
jgi:Ca-activated chloride channel family protein